MSVSQKKVYLVCKEFAGNSCHFRDQITQTILNLSFYFDVNWIFIVDQTTTTSNNTSISSLIDCLGDVWIKEILPENCLIKSVEASFFEEESADFIICLGGDGTLLNAAFRFQKQVPPILAFNFGSLGFLTYFSFEDNVKIFQDLMQNNLSILKRSRIKCTIHKYNSATKLYSSFEYHALNEILIERGPSSFLVMVDVFQNSHFLTCVHSDGLILATPTGSTAYSVICLLFNF